MNFNYIVVQAGGKGSRLEYLTYNKPKALVPIDNKPMLFHLFELYPTKQFIIIGDYKYNVLEKYLNVFSTVNHKIVDACGKSGTCAGITSALELIPENEPFLFIWSDLILPKTFDVSTIKNGNHIGLSQDFPCRWRYESDIFEEIPSNNTGVAGLFVFENKDILKDVPLSGEFVRWLSDNNLTFDIIPLFKTKEFGLLSEYEKLPKPKCRPFNHIYKEDNLIKKEALDKQGKDLAKREYAWYQKANKYGFTSIPKVYGENPLSLEEITGKNIYEYDDLTFDEKNNILKDLISALKQLHSYDSVPFDKNSYNEAYLYKTFDRLEKVKELIPFANEEKIKINGKYCSNVFFIKDKLEELFSNIKTNDFVFIHGDCTFSNTLINEDKKTIFIDPRGYFGTTEFFGDENYDWAKLYYSLVGNYDRFNLKKFSLKIDDNEITLKIDSNGWEELEDVFFSHLNNINKKEIKLIHSIIWLSLTTYAWEDYDSICGAFYNGLYYLEECLDD